MNRIQWSAAQQVAALVGLAALGCAGPMTPPKYQPGPLIRTSEISADFLWRQRIHWQLPSASGVVDAVIQKHCDDLVVILLDLLGVRLWTIRQHGFAVEAEDAVLGTQLPAEAVLSDIHRAFLWPPYPPAAGVGESHRSLPGWVVSERWADGNLFERWFRPAGSNEPETIVTYAGRSSGKDFPDQVRLQNVPFKYVLNVRTVSRTKLRCTSDQR